MTAYEIAYESVKTNIWVCQMSKDYFLKKRGFGTFFSVKRYLFVHCLDLGWDHVII